MDTLSTEIDVFSNAPNMKTILEIIVSASLTTITQPLKNVLHAQSTQDQIRKELYAYATKDLSAMIMEDVLKKEYYLNVWMEWIDYPMDNVCATGTLTLADADQFQNAPSKLNGIKTS